MSADRMIGQAAENEELLRLGKAVMDVVSNLPLIPFRTGKVDSTRLCCWCVRLT